MTKKILELHSLTKSFKNIKAVDGISFHVEEGDIFAFLGPNGAGKTTTIRMLIDIIRPDSGTMSWKINGHSASLPDPSQLGYLPEERGLYLDLPVLRTLVYLASIRGMHPGAARKEAMEWLEKLELGMRAHDKLQTLSKGNQQKVQFIASIIHKPRFAILDEPFSGFDPVNQELFIQYIREINQQGTTILLSSHQMPLVERIASRVFLINHGQEVYYGNLSGIYSLKGKQHSFDVSFETEIPQFPDIAGLENMKIIGSNQVSMSFDSGMGMNAILHSLASIPGISDLRSHQADLHDLFVSLVKKKETIDHIHN
jgi:ABC-2 type transport system ATP-binding protein